MKAAIVIDNFLDSEKWNEIQWFTLDYITATNFVENKSGPFDITIDYVKQRITDL